MTRLFIAVPALALLVALAPAAPVPHDAGKKPAIYLPTRVGSKAVYELFACTPAGRWAEVVTAVEWRYNRAVVTLRRTREDGTPEREPTVQRFAASADGVFALRPVDDGRPFELGVCRLKLPLVAGQTWDATETPKERLTATARPEVLKVRAGSFRTVRVDYESSRTNALGDPVYSMSWYAEGVGLVRMELPNASVELVSFTPGRD